MKKFFLLLAAAVFMMAGCDPTEKNSEEGTWYAFEESSTTHVGYVLTLDSGKADLILMAWGDRWKGDYTYADGKITLKTKTFYARGNAGELGNNATAIAHMEEWWEEIPPQTENFDRTMLGDPIVFEFTVKGDVAICNIANKPVEMHRQ